MKENNELLEEDEESKSTSRVRKDDNGFEHMEYDKDNKQWKLKPNIEYEVNGYNYKTDDLGRIEHVEGDLRLKDEGRDSLNAKIEDKWEGDDRGHIVGDRFYGSNQIDNIVAQWSSLNRGEYKSMEDMFAKALADKKSVKVDYYLTYGDDTKRPDGFMVEYEIDGQKDIRVFDNI